MSNPYASPQQNADSDNLSQIIAPNVRALQIITGALAQGAIVFGVIVYFVSGVDPQAEPSIISWVGIGFAVIALLLHFAIPGLVVSSGTNRLKDESFRQLSLTEKAGKVFGVFQTSHIIACALLEGAAFMNLVFVFIDSWIGNFIAAAVLLGFIVIKFPTNTSMTFKVQDKLREIEM